MPSPRSRQDANPELAMPSEAERQLAAEIEAPRTRMRTLEREGTEREKWLMALLEAAAEGIGPAGRRTRRIDGAGRRIPDHVARAA
jgi:hypothetical protein